MATWYVNATTGSDSWDGTGPVNVLDPVVDGSGSVLTSNGSVDYVNGSSGPVATIQHALTLIAAGDTVQVAYNAAGYTAPTGGIIINKSVEIVADIGTPVYSFSNAASQPVFDIQPGGTTLQKIRLRGMNPQNATRPSTEKSGNIGVKCDSTAAGSKVVWLHLEDMVVQNMGDDGIALKGNGLGVDDFLVFVQLERVTSQSNRGNGFYGRYCNTMSFRDSYFVRNGYCGVFTEFGEPQFFGANACENNSRNNRNGASSLSGVNNDATYGGQMRIKGAEMPVLSGHFEEFNNSFTATGGYVPVVGDAVTGTFIPGGTVIAAAGVAAQTLTLSNATTGMTTGSAVFESLVVNGHTFANVEVTEGSNVVVWGNYNKHGLNLENSPGATVLGYFMGNAVDYSDATCVGIWIDDNSGGAGSGDPVNHAILPGRMSNVNTSIRFPSTAANASVWLPYETHSGTFRNSLDIPQSAFHAVSWT